jgi:hypothetical protein
MIKAKKGLLIALFAAMMVFAFGATSAFATVSGVDPEDVSWNAPYYTQATYDGQTYVATQYFSSDGLTAAVVPDLEDATGKAIHVYFYDFTGATITSANPISYENYVGMNGNHEGQVAITMKKPENAISETGSATARLALRGHEPFFEYNAVNLTIKTDTNLSEDGGEAAIEAVVTTYGSQTGQIMTDSDADTYVDPILVGEIAPKTVTVNAMAGEGADWTVMNGKTEIAWTWEDGYGDAYFSGLKYDGNENTVVAKDRYNWSKKYQVRNEKTGKWSDVDAITYQHATGEWIDYRAVYSRTKADGSVEVDSNHYLSLYVGSAEAPSWKWTFGAKATDWTQAAYKLSAEQAADPSKFIVFDNGLDADVDYDTIKAYFDETYEITSETSAVDANLTKWTAKQKALTTADMKALNKKYEQFLADYGLGVEVPDEASDAEQYRLTKAGAEDVNVEIEGSAVINSKDDIVDITFAPTTKTIHVKKAKALKKAKSFTVEATSKSGNAVTYVLKTPSKKISIDPATGKVTIKNGLKKGTYKIKVTARTEAGNGYKAAQDVANITIKIKK